MYYCKFNLFKSNLALKIFSLLLFFLILCSDSFSQINYLMSVENPEQVNNNSYEFDVYIKSTDKTFILSSYQCAFDFEVMNDGGTLNFIYLHGSSQLTNIPYYSVGIFQSGTEQELTFASGFGSDSIFTSAIKVGRFRLQSSSAFTNNLFQIAWKFQGFINTILIDSDLNNITNAADHLSLYISGDLTPPTLLSASVTNSNIVELNFSERLTSASANNVSNYIINNGIVVTNAVLSSQGTLVTLTTTPHAPGILYTIIVNNITNLAGNLISSSSNSAQYFYEVPQDLKINVKVFLQGPFNNGSMHKSLNNLGFLPLNQPYNISPWNYSGGETVQKIPDYVVDWVLIEIRPDITGSSAVYSRAAFIKTDGSVVDLDGKSQVKIPGINAGHYYLVIKHRNHLAVMSADKIELSVNPSLYDFTTASEKAYGSSSQVKLSNGIYGMYAGDGNSNGNINKSDANSVWKQQNGQMGYLDGDFDMNGGVNIADKNADWKVNQNRSSNVPN